MIKHQIHNDSCDRNIQPYRESPFSDSAMFNEGVPERTFEGHNHKWNDCHSQDCMGNQNRKISSPGPSGALEPSNSRSKSNVVNDVRDQEQTRGRDRSNHTGAMSGDSFPPDHYETGDDQDSGGSVQQRVEHWQKGNDHISSKNCYGRHAWAPVSKSRGDYLRNNRSTVLSVLDPEHYDNDRTLQKDPR